MLEDKFKKDFEKWLDEQKIAPYKNLFEDIPVEVQFGYLENFAFENDIIFESSYERNTNQYYGSVINVSRGLRVDVSNNIKTPNKFKLRLIEELIILYNG